MTKNTIRIKLRSYDAQLLDKAAKEIAFVAKGTGADIVGPFPLPRKSKCFTVLRSPHVDKKSREQFKITVFVRVLDIISPSDQTMDALMKLKIYSSVDVEIK